MSNYWGKYLSRKLTEYGRKFDHSELSRKFIPYFENGQRIIVCSKWGEKERGYVGVTTGYKPSFLLIHRKGDVGSGTLLDDSYEIIGTIDRFLVR